MAQLYGVTGSARHREKKTYHFKSYIIMENIIILVFSSDLYNLDELKNMSAADRIYLANFAKTVGYDETDVLTPAQYQDLFNSGVISPENCYIFFENNA